MANDKKPDTTKPKRAPRKQALPPQLAEMIASYVATKSGGFMKVNRGSLTKAVQAALDALRGEAVAEIDRQFIETKADGLLG